MKIGFLYAGQGSQAVGMGSDLYEKYPEFKEVLDNVKLPFDVKDICFNGPAEVLNETKYTQPCMVAFAVGVTKILRERGIKPDMAAGLSLGEYSALNAAGVLSDEQVVELVAFRGQAMQEAVTGRDCKMIAVLGLERDKIFEGCRIVAEEFKGKELNVAEPANFNCPGQITVSGDAEPVDRAAEVFKELGAKKCVAVKVSGPFHTSLMKPAGDKLRERFKEENFGEMQIPVIFNAIGKEKPEDMSIQELLEKQVQSSVFFEDTIRYMAENGVDTFVEIGPGKTLSKFVSKTLTGAVCYNVEKAEDVEKIVEALK
ncbi:[acyl-carrier-protein] S-malonyltransferase [Eubacterium ruminantium]|nr:[acyl-carrier-protein] S-malonyltransferase [Eubacterium ruminantium]